MKIIIERIYSKDEKEGYLALVDRLWPRGVSKEDANLDEWCKDLAPTPDLRKWFNHEPAKWTEFRNKYMHELSSRKNKALELLDKASKKQPLILLYGAKDEEHTHAIVLKEYLDKLQEHDKNRPQYSSSPCYSHEFENGELDD